MGERPRTIPWGMMLMGRVSRYGAKRVVSSNHALGIRFMMYTAKIGHRFGTQSVNVACWTRSHAAEFPEDKIVQPGDEVLVKGKIGLRISDDKKDLFLDVNTQPHFMAIGETNVRIFLETLWDDYVRDREIVRELMRKHETKTTAQDREAGCKRLPGSAMYVDPDGAGMIMRPERKPKVIIPSEDEIDMYS